MIKTIYRYLKESNNILIVLLSAFVFRLFIANFGTLQLDQGTFIAWSNQLSNNGLGQFYYGWSDYFPGYLYILWFLGKIGSIAPGLEVLIYKLPAIFADILTGYVLYKIVSRLKNKSMGLVSAILYLFNPAIFSNSSLWGQVDSITALFSLSSIYLFPINIYFSAVCLALGTLVKPQAAFILPAFVYMLVVYNKKPKDLLRFALTGLMMFIIGFAPFNNQDNLFNFILSRFNASANQYPYGSVNAFSFWGVFGFWKPDNITFWYGLGISASLMLLVTIIALIKRPKAGEYLVSGLSLLITFLFLTRIHERHMLPALSPLLAFASVNPIIYISYGILSFTYVANLGYAYYWIVDEFKEIFNLTLVRLFIGLNILALGIAFSSFFRKITNFSLFKIRRSESKPLNFALKDISLGKTKLLLTLVLSFGLITRVYSLGLPKEMYFDEIYHSFTAKLVLHNDPKAWEWWNPHPEGFAYEWTHPPISKLGMVVGMLVFGENSFGWRIPQAIMGTVAIILVYLLAEAILKDRLAALLSAAVFSLDGLPLVLSRMGMNDSYVLVFALASVLLFIKNKNIWSFIFFGMAIASKWSAIYILPILFVSHFVFKKKLVTSYLLFLVIPILIYISSYGIMFKTGHDWSQFVEVQKQMWWYHTNLVADHPYTSPAWSWPLLLRPIYLYDGRVVDGLVARIYAFGNPAVFWFGLFSIILTALISFFERSKKIGFVVFSYLVLFLPWIASPRIMFLYHYLPSIPFMAIAVGFVLRKYPKLIPYYLITTFVLFVYFYPHWTGIRIPVWLDESYYWLSSWR